MAQSDDLCSAFQLISGDGTFNVRGLDGFSKKMKLSKHRVSYTIVSIIGPQSGGKSTLLNHLFGTTFKVMDATGPSSQTTHGIWLAKAADIDPCTLIIDVEGSDSSERAEDIAFEKQSALFALAMSDITLINVWHHDIGREQAGCIALLKIVFQVMMRLYIERKRTLLFVIRDKNPVVASLRQRFIHYTTSSVLAGDQKGKTPASGISKIAHNIWEEIVKNKDLDIPILQIMVAKERCEKILNEKFDDFSRGKVWHHVKDDLRSGHVENFGKRMTLAIFNCLAKYDKEASFYDEKVQSEKRQILQDKLLQLVERDYRTILDRLHDAALNSFKENLKNARDNGEPLATAVRRWRDSSMSEFDQGCEDVAIEQATTWDSSSVRDKLKAAIKAHIALVQAQDAAAGARREAAQANAAARADVAAARREAAQANAAAARANAAARADVAAARREAARADAAAAQANATARAHVAGARRQVVAARCEAARADSAAAQANAAARAHIAGARADAARAAAAASRANATAQAHADAARAIADAAASRCHCCSSPCRCCSSPC